MNLYDGLGRCTSLPSQLAHTDAETLFYKSLTKRQELITINPEEAHIFYVPFFPLKLELVDRNSRSCKGSISAHAILEATAQLISDSPWLSHKQHFVVSNYWRTTVMSQNSTFVRFLQQMLFFSYELPPTNLEQLGRGVYAPAWHLEVIPYAVPPAKATRLFTRRKRKFNFFYVGSETDELLSFGCKSHTPGIRSCIKNLRRNDTRFLLSQRSRKDSGFDVPSFQRTQHEHASDMLQAVFCLVFSGDTRTSAALFAALSAGCVPVIISDEISLPFPWRVPYDEFTITVRENTFASQPNAVLDTILMEYGNSDHPGTRAHVYRQRSAQFVRELSWYEDGRVVDNILLRASTLDRQRFHKQTVRTADPEIDLEGVHLRRNTWRIPLKGCLSPSIPVWASVPVKGEISYERKPLILLGIISAFKFSGKRAAIRRYLDATLVHHPCIAYVFVQGDPLQQNSFRLDRDVLHVPTLDSYEALTPKVLALFSFALSSGYHYTIKVDDSSVVNWKPTLSLIDTMITENIRYACLGETAGGYIGREVPKTFRTWHQGRSQQYSYNNWVYDGSYDTTYCAGAYGYILDEFAMFAVHYRFNENFTDSERSREIYEDKFIGEILKARGIPLTKVVCEGCDLSGFTISVASMKRVAKCYSLKNVADNQFDQLTSFALKTRSGRNSVEDQQVRKRASVIGLSMHTDRVLPTTSMSIIVDPLPRSTRK